MNNMKKIFSIVLCVMLVAALAMSTTACGKQETPATTGAPATTAAPAETEAATEAPAETEAATEAAAESMYETITMEDGAVYGEGAVTFGLTVMDPAGNSVNATVKTDAETVGEALLDLELIDGDDSDWGLYVTTVNNITLDWDKDQMYWSFYINGEFAQTGVDSTPVEEGAVYLLASSNNVIPTTTELGEGAVTFTFTVVDLEGNETNYIIHTDAETVGEALLDLELIDGNDSDWGLYVTTVNGIELDWDKDQKYWALYIDGEYAQTGVDSTPVEEGVHYEFSPAE